MLQTLHPDSSKQGIWMEKDKYEMMRNTILDVLQNDNTMTFTELEAYIEDHLQDNFDGSETWYFTTVKLDLEARGELKQFPKPKPKHVGFGSQEAI